VTALHTNPTEHPAAMAPTQLTLAVNPLTWINELFRDWWLRGTPSFKNAESTDDIGMWLWWFCVLWFVFLMALMIGFVVKYRRKKGVIAVRSASHNTPLEIAWTVIPTLFLVYIFFAGFKSYFDKVVAPGNSVVMNVVAQKWSFSLLYPNGSETNVTTTIGAREIPVFYLPAEVPIKVQLISQDVNHGFFVPDFRIKMDIFHNRYTTTWFNANPPSGSHVHPNSIAEVETARASAASKGLLYSGPGYIKEIAGEPYEDHWLFCSEYCGEQHSEMAAIIRIVPEKAYRAWLESVSSNMPPRELGASVYKVKGCTQCHSVDGSTNTGPTWKNLYGHGVEFTDGTSISAADMTDPTKFAQYVHESVTCPACKIVKGFGNNMTPQPLNEKQINGVVAYMMTLSDVQPPPGAIPENTPAGAPPAPGAAPAAPGAGPSTPAPTEKK
jgi:cytochrome c oxidase subunit II